MSQSETTYSSKCDILAELWVEYKKDPEFEDFIDYNDLGLPLAYAISTGIISSTALAENFITESFELFLTVLNIEEDTGFDSLADVLMMAKGEME